jgi:hypothetical protein
VAAATDLEHWETAWVADVDTDPAVSGDGLRVGDLSWTPVGGLDRD